MEDRKDYRRKELRYYVLANILLPVLLSNVFQFSLDNEPADFIELISKVLNMVFLLTFLSSFVYIFTFIFDSLFSAEINNPALKGEVLT